MKFRKVDRTAGKILRRLRDRAGITQMELARKTGVSYQTIQKLESGETRINIGRLFDLTYVLKTKPSDIVALVEFEFEKDDF